MIETAVSKKKRSRSFKKSENNYQKGVFNSMTYLVTGGTGFICSHICRDLVREGFKVVALDIALDCSTMKEIMTPEEMNEISFEMGDTNNFLTLAILIKKYNIERIIHLAAPLHPYSDEHPAIATQTSIMGTVNVFEAARLLGVKKVVWASTTGVFGAAQGLITNDQEHNAKNVYAKSKSHCEFLAQHYAKNFGVDQIGLRPTVVYGPGRKRGFVSYVQKLFVEPAQGKPVVVPYGDSVIDWQYVDDIAALFVHCSKLGPVKTGIYNTRGDTRSIREVRDYVLTLLPDADITLEAGGTGITESMDYDDSVLREEIGFVPKFSMERGVLSTLNYYRKLEGLPPLIDNNL